MVADWTVQDPEITAALEQHGRSGVPLYLYYEPGADAPSILPQILSVDGVVSTLKETS
jgi:thiol:disulfide interchange protein DsbD